MAKYNPRRYGQEWLRLITECRQSGMTDNVWCERHDVPVSSFYNAVTRLRKMACIIPESAALSNNAYALDFTSYQDVIRVNIEPAPAKAHTQLSKAAWHPDNPHTIELMAGDITVKISNSVDPGLLAAIFRLLKGQSY